MHLIKNDEPIANMASQLGRLLIYGDYGFFFALDVFRGITQ